MKKNSIDTKTKVCVKCGKRKMKTSFPFHKLTIDGFSSWCKPCKNEYGKELNRKKYLENPDYFYEKAAQWKEKNYDRWYELNKQYQYNWRKNNKEKYREYMKQKMKEYYQKNREALLAKARENYKKKKKKKD